MPNAAPHPRIREGFPGQRMLVLPRPVVRAALAGGADLVPTDIGYYPDAAWHDVDRPAGASQMILIYCVRGQGWASVAGRSMEVGPGDVLVIPPSTPHFYGSGGEHPWTIYWLHIAGEKVAEVHRLLTDNAAQSVFSLGEDPDTLSLFEEAWDLLHEAYGPDELLLASLCIGRLLGRLIALHRRRPESISTRQRIDRTIAFMKQRLARRVSIPELARLANLSPSHFAAAFKRHTGYPALDFFIRLKMRRACELLDTTPLPIKLIAAELGFDDPLYFSRQFRKVHDLSPAQYRAIAKG